MYKFYFRQVPGEIKHATCGIIIIQPSVQRPGETCINFIKKALKKCFNTNQDVDLAVL